MAWDIFFAFSVIIGYTLQWVIMITSGLSDQNCIISRGDLLNAWVAPTRTKVATDCFRFDLTFGIQPLHHERGGGRERKCCILSKRAFYYILMPAPYLVFTKQGWMVCKFGRSVKFGMSSMFEMSVMSMISKISGMSDQGYAEGPRDSEGPGGPGGPGGPKRSWEVPGVLMPISDLRVLVCIKAKIIIRRGSVLKVWGSCYNYRFKIHKWLNVATQTVVANLSWQNFEACYVSVL